MKRLSYVILSGMLFALFAGCGPQPISNRVQATAVPRPTAAATLTPTPHWEQSSFRSRVELVTRGLDHPVSIVSPFDGTNRLFVVERDGRIRIIQSGQILDKSFLDLRDRVATKLEQALQNMVFAPDFPTSGNFYVFYNRKPDGALVLERYRVSEDPNVAAASSATKILVIPHPVATHNGGQLQFGKDGYLYVSIGDGNDPTKPYNNNSQSLDTWLGKILRIDVNADTYRVPVDNPFVNTPNALPEIWAYGLRNPWRFYWDYATDDFYIADVGDLRYEEVNVLNAANVRGKNFGWPRMEGTRCYMPNVDCQDESLTPPVFEYPHAYGCAIVGGVVYHSARIPELQDHYLFGDYCFGRLWAMHRDGVNGWRVQELGDLNLRLGAIAEGENGKIYLADYRKGNLYRLVIE